MPRVKSPALPGGARKKALGKPDDEIRCKKSTITWIIFGLLAVGAVSLTSYRLGSISSERAAGSAMLRQSSGAGRPGFSMYRPIKAVAREGSPGYNGPPYEEGNILDYTEKKGDIDDGIGDQPEELEEISNLDSAVVSMPAEVPPEDSVPTVESSEPISDQLSPQLPQGKSKDPAEMDDYERQVLFRQQEANAIPEDKAAPEGAGAVPAADAPEAEPAAVDGPAPSVDAPVLEEVKEEQAVTIPSPLQIDPSAVKGPTITLVTSILAIDSESKPSASSAVAAMVSLCRLQLPVVIYIQPEIQELEEVQDALQQLRPGSVKLIPMTLDPLRTHTWSGMIESIRKDPAWLKGKGVKKSPQATLELYNFAGFSRLSWLQNAAEQNYFNTDAFLWIDANSPCSSPRLFQPGRLSTLMNWLEVPRLTLFSTTDPIVGNDTHGPGFPWTDFAAALVHDGTSPIDANVAQLSTVRGFMFGGTVEAVTAARAAHDRITDSALTSGRMGSDDTILTILAHTQADLVNVIPIPLDNYCYPLEQALSDRGPPFDSSQRVKLRGGYDLRGVTCDLWEYLDEDERQRVGTPVQWQGKDIACFTSEGVCPSNVNPDFLEFAATQYMCFRFDNYCKLRCKPDGEVLWSGFDCPLSAPCPPFPHVPASFFDVEARKAQEKAAADALVAEETAFQSLFSSTGLKPQNGAAVRIGALIAEKNQVSQLTWLNKARLVLEVNKPLLQSNTKPNSITLVGTYISLARLSKISNADSFLRPEQEYFVKLAEFLKFDMPKVLYCEKADKKQILKLYSSAGSHGLLELRHKTIEDLRDAEYSKLANTLRTRKSWLAQQGVENTPQASNPLYLPLVFSKMFWLAEAARDNPFESEAFLWMDTGGMCNNPAQFSPDKFNLFGHFFDKFLLTTFETQYLFDTSGFTPLKLLEYSGVEGETLKLGMKGGAFGGTQSYIEVTAAVYEVVLLETLRAGYMGTEESVMTIMFQRFPQLFHDYAGNGDSCAVFGAVLNNPGSLQ